MSKLTAGVTEGSRSEEREKESGKGGKRKNTGEQEVFLTLKNNWIKETYYNKNRVRKNKQ